MAIEQIGEYLYKQKRGTKLTVMDLENLASYLNRKYQGNFVEVTLVWFDGLSMYGFNMDELQRRYNVGIILK